MKLGEMIPFEQILNEELRDPLFRAEWERLAPARAVANRLIAYRAERGLTQTALGRLLGMSQPAVARIEAGDHLPSLQTLFRLSETLGLEIVVAMMPPDRFTEASTTKLETARIEERVTTPQGASMTIAIR